MLLEKNIGQDERDSDARGGVFSNKSSRFKSSLKQNLNLTGKMRSEFN